MTIAAPRRIWRVHFIVRCGENKPRPSLLRRLTTCVELLKDCRNRYTIREFAVAVSDHEKRWPIMLQLAGKTGQVPLGAILGGEKVNARWSMWPQTRVGMVSSSEIQNLSRNTVTL